MNKILFDCNTSLVSESLCSLEEFFSNSLKKINMQSVFLKLWNPLLTEFQGVFMATGLEAECVKSSYCCKRSGSYMYPLFVQSFNPAVL